MAKCAMCNSKKGKRKCMLAEGLVCSPCCGESRTEEACSACGFYQKPKRNYREVPAYSIPEMRDDVDLDSYGRSIEGALCAYDKELGEKLYDRDAIRILELLIDKYHFHDQKTDQESEMVMNGFNYVDESIREDLKDVEEEDIVKIVGIIRFVARRRSRDGREYMRVVHQYVGPRVAPGVTVLPFEQR